MSLKRIELQGFKSFREKTVINFEHGYTCIVGPNGCGKSNVSDAIRWVLGEQSAKQLRGENMKGVIFSGTATLPEMGYAEVTLVFDNSSGMFHTPLEEIAITRKIFRSKPDNYYFINHKPCRRSDIIELLRDTGAGKESFSIIEQGAVSEIMKVKPVERRRIFDEAAGIASAKEEKRKNLRTLENTNNNIATLNARVEEMDKQLEPLKRQVEKLRKYEEYSKDLKEQEYNIFIYKYENADKDKGALRVHIGELDEYIRDHSISLERGKARKESLDREILANDERVRQLLAQKEKMVEARARASGDQQAHKAKQESIEATLSSLEESLQIATTTRDTTGVQLAESREAYQALKESVLQKEIDLSVLNANLEDVVNQLQSSESAIEAETSMQMASLSKLSEVASEQAGAEAELKVLRENIQSAEEEIGATRVAIAEEQKHIDDATGKQAMLGAEFEQVNKQRTAHSTSINESRFKLNEVDRKVRECEDKVKAKEITVQSLKNTINAKKGYSKAVSYLKQMAGRNPAVDKHLMGVVMDLYKVEDSYAEAIEVALGSAVNHVVTRSQDDANQLINIVRQAGVGRITCMPMDRIRGESLAFEYRRALNEDGVLGVASDLIDYDRRFDEIFKRLLGRIIVVEDYDVGKLLDSRYKGGLKIVTLDGKLFDPSGTLSGGSRRTPEEAMLEKERKELDILKAELEKESKAHDALALAMQESERFLVSSRDKLDELNGQYGELTATIKAHEATLSVREKRLEELSLAKELTTRRLAVLEVGIQKAKESGDSIATYVDADKLLKAKESKEGLTAMRDELMEKRNAMSLDINTIRTQIAGLDRDIKRLAEENARSLSAINGLTLDIERVKEELQQHINNRPSLVFTEEEAIALADIQAKIDECDALKVGLREQLAGIGTQLDEINQRILLSTNDRTKAEGKIEKIDAELTQWTEKIWEDYGKTYDDICTEKNPEFDHVKAPSLIAVLRANITKLGDINFEAATTYEEVGKERELVAGQVEDAIRAKDNIEQLIQQITKEMNIKFDEAFQVINENFSTTFIELFGGGAAELILTENLDDPDEKGVDICVQLPGKSRGPLSRLSGGEQSLTAIAILFAILKLKPMPFVVLDEVESALDEVNCNRFARFLRRYAESSRFVVITHKKPTMENADVLYGATMPNRGVTSIVSVNLETAFKHVQEE